MSLRPLHTLLALTLLVTAACSDKSNDVTTATLATPTTEPSDPSTTSTTTAELGIDRVPGTVTIEYAQRVIDALDASYGAFLRQYKADGGPTVDNIAWLGEIYSEPEFARVESALGQMAAQDFRGIFPQPGNPETLVREIVRQNGSCVLLRTRRSLDAIRAGAPENETPVEAEERMTLFVGLATRDTLDERNERNPTAWTIILDGRMSDDSIPDTCQ